MSVPVIHAKSITQTRASDTVIRIILENQNIRSAAKKSITASMIPFTRLKSISLKNLLPRAHFILPFASHCTTRADACTQTFQAIATTRGVKKKSSPYDSMASSKPQSAVTAKKPQTRAIKSHGKRALTISRIFPFILRFCSQISAIREFSL